MKKLLLASLIAGASFTASADVVTFDTTSFGGSMVTFDFIDMDADIAQVTQTDDNASAATAGTLLGAEEFSEMGSTDVVNFKLGQTLLGVDAAYEVFFNYDFSGMATTTADGEINVAFDSGTSGLYVDTLLPKNGMFDGGTEVASFDFNAGGCEIDIAPGPLQNKGFCVIDLNINFAAGYFFDSNGVDLSTTGNAQSAELIVTVQDIFGLDFDYTTPGATQNFQILHDGNMTFSVPEPTSVAILGLGLLGFAASRRKA